MIAHTHLTAPSCCTFSILNCFPPWPIASNHNGSEENNQEVTPVTLDPRADRSETNSHGPQQLTPVSLAPEPLTVFQASQPVIQADNEHDLTAHSSSHQASGQGDSSDLALISCHVMTDEQKYQILKCSPTQPKEYPINSQKRRFQPKWMQEFPWIRYSVSADGIFCAPCLLFSSARFNSEFVTAPFRDWKNAVGTARGTLNRHSSSQNHIQCQERAIAFIAVMEKRKLSIKSQLSSVYDNQVQKNAKALVAIVDIIQYLVRQGLALRGHTWNKETKREGGNFSTMVDFVAKYSPELSSHLTSSARNARYLSPRIQNEFISINGDLIRKAIVEECNASLFWSLMLDETTDVSRVEQVSVCVRYVGTKKELEVCEEFLGFCSVSCTDAETITSTIVTFLNNCGLTMDKLTGKGFDGAATMSGHVSGVSARLEQQYPNARYFTHC